MKRRLVLEYRIRKLEKTILEDIDQDLDKMSDDILKKDPYVDLDAELDKKAKDIIDKEPGYFYKTDPFGDRVRTYDTIEEWLDDKTAEIQLNPARQHKGDVTQQLNLTVKLLTHMIDGLKYVRRLKNYIKEISNMNVLVAQQKLVSALRKRIREAEKSNSDNKTAKDIADTHYKTVNDWIDSMAFNNEVEAEDKVTGIKYAIAHLKGMLDDQTSARLKEGGLDFGLHRAAEIKNDIEELRNTNVLIANQKMVSALRKKIKELESELKDIKSRKRLESLVYEGKRDLDLLRSYIGDDLYDSYMSIRNKIPSDADLNKQYPEFTEDDIFKDEKLFIKKYFNVRNSNIIAEFGEHLFSKYPKSISSEELHNNTKQCISDYDDIVNFVKQTFNNFRSFERLKKMDIDDIRDFVNSYISVRASKDSDKVHGAKKLYEDSNWVVYRITSYDAARYYGKNTRWCISGNYPGHEGLGERYFNNYIRDYNLDGGYYFYISKKDHNEKYCVLKKQPGDIASIWDASDTDLGNSTYWADLDLPYVKEIGLNTSDQEDLFFAIKDGDLEMVKQCVNDNTINAVTPTGWTPLMIAAAKSGNAAVEIAEYLIDNGADVSHVSKDGSTALSVACLSDCLQMVKLLVEYGNADLDELTSNRNLLEFLAEEGTDVRNYLISKGVKID